MNICFISQNGFTGKTARTFDNCRTEFAWQIALDAHHENYKDWFFSNTTYDLIVVILPKKLELIDTGALLESVKRRSKKVAMMQEGPAWYYQDYDYAQQVNYINFLSEMDFLLVHNISDIAYFKGIFKKSTFNLQSLMITDTLAGVIRENNGMPIIGGNFCSWYGGVDSYFVAQNFGKPIYVPSMGRKINNEEQFPNLLHLPYMTWTNWMRTLANFNVGVHLMRTHAAGTFALNCAYWGIPCIGYKGLDTQQTLFPDLSVCVGDIVGANELAIKLKNDVEFYNYISLKSKDLYQLYYSETVWKARWNTIYEQIKN